MPAPDEPAHAIELQPTVASHVSRRELRTGGPTDDDRPDGGVVRLLRPVLLALAALCCLAIVALLVVNTRLGDVADGSGTIGSLDAARDMFDRWIRPAFIVAAGASGVLVLKWLGDDPAHRRPSLRRFVVAACLVAFAACTIIGAAIGSTTIADAQIANRWAIASYGVLAVGCIMLFAEVGTARTTEGS